MKESLSRREFLQVSSAAAAATALPGALASAAEAPAPGPYRGTLCMFSKPVPQLSWQELAQAAKRAGFGGIDLTVRNELGHVMPERAAEDLPKAVAAIRAEGLEVPMITSELTRGDDPTARPILSTAAKLNIPYFKPGYYHYKFVDVRKELEEAGTQFRGLIEVAKQYGVQAGYHNHSGNVGAQVWDMARVMDTIDPKAAGYYYDLLNATMEGGASGWRIDANLVMPRLKMLGAKDFYWVKDEKRGWHGKSCPIGEGMCHWPQLLKTVAAANFHGPISLHVEYQIEGVSDNQGRALSREKCDVVMAAVTKDLQTLKSLVHEAYEGAA